MTYHCPYPKCHFEADSQQEVDEHVTYMDAHGLHELMEEDD